MTDANLIQLLTTSFLPFAKAFATKPDAVTLTVTCTPQEVLGRLRYAAEDHEALTQGSMTDVDLGRAFRVLSHWTDGRAVALVLQALPEN